MDKTNKHNYSTVEDRSKHREQKVKALLGAWWRHTGKPLIAMGRGWGREVTPGSTSENTPLSYTPPTFCFSRESTVWLIKSCAFDVGALEGTQCV